MGRSTEVPGDTPKVYLQSPSQQLDNTLYKFLNQQSPNFI